MKLNVLLLLGAMLGTSAWAQQTQSIYFVSSTSADGKSNVTVGPYAGISSGSQTVSVGAFAGQNNTGGINVFVGYQAGLQGNSGAGNAFVGGYAGYSNLAGYNNSFLGSGSGYSNTSGYFNAFLGANAGYNNSTGYYNTFLGTNAGYSNTKGNFNTVIGMNAGYYNSGSSNSFVGYDAGNANTSGQQNTFIGVRASYRNQSGFGNVSVGSASSYTNVSGNFNVMLGDSAGYRNTVSGNVFVGSKAGIANTTGINNSFLGYHAGYNVTTGSNNIIIGPTSGTAVTDGTDNVLMGYNSQAEDGLHNSIAIGANSRVAVSNALILGNQVNVGIGTSVPTNRLEVVSESPNSSGLTLTNLTTTSPTNLATDQFLTVNEQGDVIKARYRLRINNPSEWSDKVFMPSYQLRSITSVTTYIDQNGHLPGVPSAEQVVKEGVDLVKMNAILLEKVEELTLYSIQQDKANQLLQQQQKHDQQKLQALEQKQADLELLLRQVLRRK